LIEDRSGHHRLDIDQPALPCHEPSLPERELDGQLVKHPLQLSLPLFSNGQRETQGTAGKLGNRSLGVYLSDIFPIHYCKLLKQEWKLVKDRFKKNNIKKGKLLSYGVHFVFSIMASFL
jgi:hypothetical protein